MQAPGIVVGDHPADFCREVIAADSERVAATDEVVARALDGARGDIAVTRWAGAAGKIDEACGIGDEPRVAAGAVVQECRGAVVGDDCCIAGGAVAEEYRGSAVVGRNGRVACGAVASEMNER